MPCFVPLVPTARTISPVWKLLTFLAPLGLEQGKPISLTLYFGLLQGPLAEISKGLMRAILSECGALLPTQAASIQCAFGSPLCVRLNLVRPPEPHSMGRPSCLRRSYRAHLVVLTAAASLRGALACARMRASRSGFPARNTRIS